MASGEYTTVTEPGGEPAVQLRRRRRRGRRRPRSVTFGASRYIVGYDNPAVDMTPLNVPRPKMTLEEAAMQSVTNRVANQPRLHVRRVRDEPQLVYTRGIYRPQPVYWRGTSDSQGFSFLHNSSQDSRSKDALDRTNEDEEEDDDIDDEIEREESPGPGMDLAHTTILKSLGLLLSLLLIVFLYWVHSTETTYR